MACLEREDRHAGQSSCRSVMGSSSVAGNGLVHDRLERPAPPACIRFPIAIADGATYSACRSKIKPYRARIDGYLKCLKWEADASTDEYNDAVRSFSRLSE